MADGLSNAVNGLVKVGVGVFVILLVLTLNYSAYASARNNIQSASWNSNNFAQLTGVTSNFTSYAGGTANTFGSNIQLAVFALIFAAIILAVVSSLREATGGNEQGGFL